MHSARKFFRSFPWRFLVSACSEQALEIAAFCPRVNFAEGAVAADFGTVVPVVVGGARTQPAAPMMAADTAMIGSSFMDFSRRGEDQLLTATFVRTRREGVHSGAFQVCADRWSALHASA
jgi:hypothetical protein